MTSEDAKTIAHMMRHSNETAEEYYNRRPNTTTKQYSEFENNKIKSQLEGLENKNIITSQILIDNDGKIIFKKNEHNNIT